MVGYVPTFSACANLTKYSGYLTGCPKDNIKNADDIISGGKLIPDTWSLDDN
jgi:hypothetical protein